MTVVIAQSILYLCSNRRGNQWVWPITEWPLIACNKWHATGFWLWAAEAICDSSVSVSLYVSVYVCVLLVFFLSTSVLVPVLQSTKGCSKFQRAIEGGKKRPEEIKLLPVCSVCHLMFYSEMSSRHFTLLVIYIGPAWTNEGFFFLLPPQCKDKDRRRRKLFAIWSINKNANSGKPFLSCDNGGVVIAAAQRQRDRWTHPYPNSLSLNCNTQTQERRGGIHLFLRTSFFVTITCFCTMPWQGLSEHKSRSGWPRAGGRRGLQPRSVNQSIGHRDNGKDTPCEAQRWDIYWWTGHVLNRDDLGVTFLQRALASIYRNWMWG